MSNNDQKFIEEMVLILRKQRKIMSPLKLAQLLNVAFSKEIESYHYGVHGTKSKVRSQTSR